MRKACLLAVPLLLLDQVSKFFAMRLTSPVVLLEGILRLRFMQNTGVAFSLLADAPFLPPVLAVVLLAALLYGLRKLRFTKTSTAAVGLIIAGAVGNEIDRLFRGFVVDMIEPLFMNFAVFNVADVYICVGCGLLALSILLQKESWKEVMGG